MIEWYRKPDEGEQVAAPSADEPPQKKSFLRGFVGMRFGLLLYNFRPLIIFELLYYAVTVALAKTLFWWLLGLVMDSAGLSVLNAQTLPELLKSPWTIIFLAALVLGLAIYALIEISAALFAFDCSRQRKKVTFKSLVVFSLMNAVRIIHPRNLFIIVVVLVMIPLVGMGISSSLLSSITIPASFLEFISSNTVFAAVFLVLLVVMFFLVLRWTFAVPYFTLERLDFLSAIKKSARLVRGNRFRNFFSMLLVQAIIGLINIASLTLGTYVITWAITILGKTTVFGSVAVSLILIAYAALYCVLNALYAPISCLKISALFYDRKEASTEPIVDVEYQQPERLWRPKKGFWIGVGSLAFVVIAVCSLGIHAIALGALDTVFEESSQTEVIAYYGSSALRDGNSLETIKKSAAEGAQSCTVNVQRTKDGKLILMHDRNLSNVYQVNKDVSEVTYEELAQLQKSLIGEVSQGAEGVALLSDAINVAKEQGVGLIIDITSTGRWEGDVSDIAYAINEAGYADRCSIFSHEVEDLEEAKADAPSMRRILYLGASVGLPKSIAAADAYAIDALCVTNNLLVEAKEKSVAIIIWGIVGESAMEDAVGCEAAGLACMDVDLAAEVCKRRGMPKMLYNAVLKLQE